MIVSQYPRHLAGRSEKHFSEESLIPRERFHTQGVTDEHNRVRDCPRHEPCDDMDSYRQAIAERRIACIKKQKRLLGRRLISRWKRDRICSGHERPEEWELYDWYLNDDEGGCNLRMSFEEWKEDHFFHDKMKDLCFRLEP